MADGAIHTALFDLLQHGGAARNAVPAAGRLFGPETSVQVLDQAGLVNPNTASPDLLAALMLRLGADAGSANRMRRR